MPIDFPSNEPYLRRARENVLHRIRRHRRLRVTAIAGGSVLAVVAVTGGALVVRQAGTTEAANSVVCYAHDDLGSLTSTVAVATAMPSPGVSAPPAAAVDKAELCALAWRGGLGVAAANGGHAPDVDPNTSTLPVPELAFCRLPNGITGGFPVEAPSTTPGDVCDRLGLPVDTSVHG